MPARENSDKVIRYREHRRQLTRFADHRALAPKYAMFSELLMLWLDSKGDNELKTWTALMFFMGAPFRRKNSNQEYETSDFTEESPIDRSAKEQMKSILQDFMAEEDDDTIQDQSSGS